MHSSRHRSRKRRSTSFRASAAPHRASPSGARTPPLRPHLHGGGGKPTHAPHSQRKKPNRGTSTCSVRTSRASTPARTASPREGARVDRPGPPRSSPTRPRHPRTSRSSHRCSRDRRNGRPRKGMPGRSVPRPGSKDSSANSIRSSNRDFSERDPNCTRNSRSTPAPGRRDTRSPGPARSCNRHLRWVGSSGMPGGSSHRLPSLPVRRPDPPRPRRTRRLPSTTRLPHARRRGIPASRSRRMRRRSTRRGPMRARASCCGIVARRAQPDRFPPRESDGRLLTRHSP